MSNGIICQLNGIKHKFKGKQFNSYKCVPFWSMVDSSSGRYISELAYIEQELQQLLQATSSTPLSQSAARGNLLIDLVISAPGSVLGASVDGSNAGYNPEQQQAKEDSNCESNSTTMSTEKGESKYSSYWVCYTPRTDSQILACRVISAKGKRGNVGSQEHETYQKNTTALLLQKFGSVKHWVPTNQEGEYD